MRQNLLQRFGTVHKQICLLQPFSRCLRPPARKIRLSTFVVASPACSTVASGSGRTAPTTGSSSTLAFPRLLTEWSRKSFNPCIFYTGHSSHNCWLILSRFCRIERLSKKDKVLMRSSPNSGKVRLQDNFFYSTASLGKEPHIFVKSHERRLHHNGDLFVVRNGGHSAGIDARGKLNIF